MGSARLASDLDNTDFTGASNPDSRLAVMFYSRPMPHEFESEKQGRPIFYDQDFVKIFVPGDTTSVIDTPVRDEHKKRFPLHWAHYQNKHGGDQKEIGTPLSQWPRLSPAQVEELHALKFYTVENVANASDASLQRLGMVAGMSPFAFRDHAIRFLALAKDDSIAHAAEEKAKALEARLEAMQQETDAKIAAAVAAAVAAATAPKKRGPKAKVTEG
jgi:hypothetical protein